MSKTTSASRVRTTYDLGLWEFDERLAVRQVA